MEENYEKANAVPQKTIDMMKESLYLFCHSRAHPSYLGPAIAHTIHVTDFITIFPFLKGLDDDEIKIIEIIRMILKRVGKYVLRVHTDDTIYPLLLSNITSYERIIKEINDELRNCEKIINLKKLTEKLKLENDECTKEIIEYGKKKRRLKKRILKNIYEYN